MPTDTLLVLHERIVACLNIAPDLLLQYILNADVDTCGGVIEDTTAAAELSGCRVTVVVNREPDWCTNKCFKKVCESQAQHVQRSCQVDLKVLEGGRFLYQRHFQRIGLAWWVDENTTARGRWQCRLEDGDQVLLLSGTAKVLKCHQARNGRCHRDLHASAFSWAMPKTQLLEDDWLTSPV
ncbi:Uncharacterized protein SCF082_LOCUS40546 [Durusdinium trenchii]